MTTRINYGPYLVTLWGSDPEEGNDDQWVSADFYSRDEAQAAFLAPETVSGYGFQFELVRRTTVFIELTNQNGDEHEVLATRRLRPDVGASPGRAAAADDWRREIAREEGMLHGAEAFNEVMGWD